MTSSERAQLPDDHRLHDPLLIARAMDEDLEPPARAAADALLETCPDCRLLAADLKGLRSATSALPMPARARDFRLSQAQAGRLRRSALERFLAPLGRPTFAFLQPLAGVAIAIGLGLLVVTSIPLGLGGSAASQPQAQYATGGPENAGSPGASAAPGGAVAGSVQSPAPVEFGPNASRAPLASIQPDKATDTGGTPAPAGGTRTSEVPRTAANPQTSDLREPVRIDWPLIGVVLAIAGFALLVARRYARRLPEDRLLS